MELPCKSNFKVPQNFVALLPPIYWLDVNIVSSRIQIRSDRGRTRCHKMGPEQNKDLHARRQKPDNMHRSQTAGEHPQERER